MRKVKRRPEFLYSSLEMKETADFGSITKMTFSPQLDKQQPEAWQVLPACVCAAKSL